MAGRNTFKARFIPKNPSKYVGNVNKVIARSSWEIRFFQWLDNNPAVVQWNSEELAVPYLNPVKTAQRGQITVSNYYPDCIVKYKTPDGGLKTEIIEIKPLYETVARPGMSPAEKETFAVNTAKWKAADIYAKKNGATFRILTEKELFRQAPKRGKK